MCITIFTNKTIIFLITSTYFTTIMTFKSSCFSIPIKNIVDTRFKLFSKQISYLHYLIYFHYNTRTIIIILYMCIHLYKCNNHLLDYFHILYNYYDILNLLVSQFHHQKYRRHQVLNYFQNKFPYFHYQYYFSITSSLITKFFIIIFFILFKKIIIKKLLKLN